MATKNNITVRPPENIQEIKDVETLQRLIWGSGEPPVPYHLAHAVIHAGGVVLCAFDLKDMIGFCLSFQGQVENKLLLWSHMTGVIPSYQGQMVGYQIKMAQRQAALDRGIETIAWTYDPMRRGNANFNLCLLGGTVECLHPEFYGEMPDELNKGLVSDRFEVHWDLKSERVTACAAGNRIPYMDPAAYALRVNKNLEPQPFSLDSQPETIGIELPAELDKLRQESPALTHTWYYMLREAVFPLFQAGYRIEGLAAPSQETFTYVLQRKPTWYLYVLETSDGSFYTGITTDLEKRVAEHNAGTGKGARYTRSRRPVQLIAAWRTYGRQSAAHLEYAFKQLTRPQKRRFIDDNHAAFREALRVY